MPTIEQLDRRVTELETRVLGTHTATLRTDTVVIGNLLWHTATSRDRLKHKDAEAYCAALRTAGHADWRLPTIQELLSLVDYTRHDPAIDTDKFPDTQSNWYWSSSPDASSPADYAWFVYFNYGAAACGDRDGTAFVRAVRSVAPASEVKP